MTDPNKTTVPRLTMGQMQPDTDAPGLYIRCDNAAQRTAIMAALTGGSDGHDQPNTAEAQASVCRDIQIIMKTYRDQEASGNIDTPGGLEHMGDVWQQLAEWDALLSGAKP